VPNTVDPLGGSYYVEHLTSELERRAMELLGQVDELGGAAKAIGASFFQREIARSAYEYQMRIERGEAVVVGVNKFADDSEMPAVPTPDYSKLEQQQIQRVRDARAKRNANAATAALNKLGKSADRFLSSASVRGSLVPAIVEAARARATVGEIASVLQSRWGQYRPS
jgi:methylmalonyl-CoA mutase N-terminal domain/subunit